MSVSNNFVHPTIEQIITEKLMTAMEADGYYIATGAGPHMKAAIAGIAATFVNQHRPMFILDPAQLPVDEVPSFKKVWSTGSIRETGKSYAADVMEFMVAMDQLPNQLCDFAQMSPEFVNLASQLMFGGGEGAKKGEVWEMKEAWAKFCQSRSLEHLVEFVDGGIDSIYVILWTLNKLGVPVDLCWHLVQRSNMAKLGPDGKAIKDPETGKVKKPEGWQPPDLFGALQSAASGVTYVGGLARHD